jgi:hypothetical protein
MGPKRTVPKRDSEWVRKESFRNSIQNGPERNRSEIRRRTQNRSEKTGLIVFKLQGDSEWRSPRGFQGKWGIPVSDPVSHGIDSSTYNDMIEEGFLEIIEYSAQHEFDDLTSGIFKHFQKQWI